MAKDVQAKKRKASMPETGVEKPQNFKSVPVEAPPLPAKKRKATEDAAPIKSKKSKIPSDTKSTKAVSKPEPKVNGGAVAKVSKTKIISEVKPAIKNKEASSSLVTPAKKDKAVPKGVKAIEKQDNASAKTSKVASGEIDEVDQVFGDDGDDGESDYDSEADDQTQALLQGFESESDEEDALNEEGLAPGQQVPKRHALSKKNEKKLKKAAEAGNPGKPGVVYIGRIPHGFFEHEMKEYFTQFGNILKLRLSRNKKTGASKHYGWIQFESAEVADIVAKTMDNYLMFGHLLKVRVVAEENVSPELFKGANKRFKAVPWNKIEGRKLEQGKSEGTWDKKQELEEQRREKKAAKLKEIGYEFDSPTLKSAASVLKNKKALLEKATEEIKAIEAAPSLAETSKPKMKAKGEKKAKAEVAEVETTNGDVSTKTVTSKSKKKENRAAVIEPSKEDIQESLNALIVEETAKVDEPVATELTKKVEKKAKTDKKRKVADVSEAVDVDVTADTTEKKPKAKKPKATLVENDDVEIKGMEAGVKKQKKKKSKVEVLGS